MKKINWITGGTISLWLVAVQAFVIALSLSLMFSKEDKNEQNP